MSERLCNFPGCTNSIEGMKPGTRWCHGCRDAMYRNTAMRRVGKRVREALFPFTNRVLRGDNVSKTEAPRVADVKCARCGGMPWARELGRTCESLKGGGGDEWPVCYPPGLGVPGCSVCVCIGCGLPHGPELVEQLCGGVRSSAGLASDYADMYGIEIKMTGRRG